MPPPGSRLVQFELFKRVLGIELKRSQRYGFPLSILLASLDRDVASGDRDLLASAARSAIRDIDIPVAFGESDVLVVMPHTDLDGAQLVAERIRKRVRASAAPAAAGGGTTASIGVVAVDGGQRLDVRDDAGAGDARAASGGASRRRPHRRQHVASRQPAAARPRPQPRLTTTRCAQAARALARQASKR